MTSGYLKGMTPRADEKEPTSRNALRGNKTSEQWGYEAAFRESEDRWRKLLELSGDCIYLQVEGRFVFVNPPMARLLGETNTHDLVGRRVLELIHPDDRRAAQDRMDTAMQSGSVLSSEGQRFVVLDGRAVRVSVCEAPVVYGGRKATQVTVQDITARQRAEEAVRISQERFEALVQTINEGFAVLDAEGIITHANYRFRQIVGFSIEELNGRSMADLLERASRNAFSKHFHSAGRKKRRVECEALVQARDGRMVSALLSLYGLHERDGKFSGAYIAITDVTEFHRDKKVLEELRNELAKSAPCIQWDPGVTAELVSFSPANTPRRKDPADFAEECFQAVFERMGDAAYLKDTALKFTKVNSSMERMFRMSRSELVGTGSETLYDEHAARQVLEIEKRVLLGESIDGECTRTVKGLPLTVHEIRVPLRDKSGTVVGMCGIIRDLTDHALQPRSESPATFEYPSKAMQAALEKARQAAATDSAVLLQGESGSGKDFLARFIHSQSARKKGPYFEINCAALSYELAESELFGHESGAFTGARGRKKGLVELAEGGTMLLNEIGELPIGMQAKLLTFLDSKTFIRVGGEKPVFVNTRIIAATHRDLKEEVAEGRFLKALYYRLNVFSIRVPALRERIEDVPILVKELLERLVKDLGGSRVPALGSAYVDALRRHSWPGNVRELRNVLERTLILADSGRGGPDLGTEDADGEGDLWKPSRFPTLNIQMLREQLTRVVCEEALRRSRGNKKLAAQLLGVSRYSFYRYMEGTGMKEEEPQNCDTL
ncbi:MAG: sigma 54-interacting transcriptional regulator [Thermodesulfobacteriota bacterium]